jgi:hypothetical protein
MRFGSGSKGTLPLPFQTEIGFPGLQAAKSMLKPGVNSLYRFCKSIYFLFLVGQVLKPKGAYSGQKLIRLVNTNTTANTKSSMPSVPVIVPLK